MRDRQQRQRTSIGNRNILLFVSLVLVGSLYQMLSIVADHPAYSKYNHNYEYINDSDNGNASSLHNVIPVQEEETITATSTATGSISESIGNGSNRLDIINNDLDKTVASISEQKEQVEETVKQLNETLLDFKEQNEELKGQNDQLLQTSDALRGDIANLTLNLDDVRETEAQLKEDVAELKTVEERLKEDKITLTAQADNLNSTVEKLSEEVSNFKKENKEFKDLNEELRQIVSFIGDEAENVERTYEALTSYLADAIIRKQVLTMTALKEGMKKELAAWECGFRTAFSGQDFLKDENAPIGYSSYDTVMSYTGKFLQNLCLLRGNLETFLVNEVILSGQSIWDISSKDLSAGINIYTTNALDHYFPDEGEEGLNSTSWDEIDYDCIELPIEQRYYYAVA
uniref:Uncharacterized protein n=1 Tax=Chaetoceros debilis TaxID=122233 RepID=A0A7S3QD00_9STRA